MSQKREKAMFAGGCFWCMVQPFDEQPGILEVLSGYSGGEIDNPTYQQVKSGETGHYEVVQITYDPDLFSYEKLLSLYWPQIDPTDPHGQFQDRGSQYRTAIFYYTEQQRVQAEATKTEIEKSGRFKKTIVTEILPAKTFYLAEEKHQKFYKTHKEEYKLDRKKSGRDEFIKENWNK
ncbi:peptide-methionine (S)-S-oxide reductase MsrA [Alkalihalophilus sp. As8PL]|uniref:Peptide methionine sulfoxide reductase MsrA n=1 Tax=Alkalihalophilus sp. As8PL TaxID=3237103 RepID=A0AB39BT95_9BACI